MEFRAGNMSFSKRERNRWRKMRKRIKNKKKRLGCEANGDDVRVVVGWAELPKSILEEVFERVSMLDRISIANVCKSWRGVFSPELLCWEKFGFPLLVMSGQRDQQKRTFVSMLEKRAWDMDLPEAREKYCWGSVHDWLVLVDHVEYFSLDIILFNPFTRTRIDLPRTWDFYHKIVFSGLPQKENVVCMLVNGQTRELKFCAPHQSQSWHECKLSGDDDKPFEDAVFCGGSFFLLTKENDIYQIDASVDSASLDGVKTQIHKPVTMPEGDEDSNKDGVLRYLVESRGEVLLVLRFFNSSPGSVFETTGFKVYSLDLVVMSWTRVKHLGDRVLCIGKCSSRSFSARELGGEMGNSIYFSNDNHTPWFNEWHSCPTKGLSTRFGLNNSGRRHWGVFRLGNKGNDKFRFRGDRDNAGPVWFTAPLWWYCNNFTVN